MKTNKVKTIAEIAKEYGVTKKEFQEMLDIGKVMKKPYTVPYFDGKLFYPAHQEHVYKTLGNPFKPVEIEDDKPPRDGFHLNINYSKYELDQLVKKMASEFTKIMSWKY